MEILKNKIAGIFYKLGFSADVLTIIGLLTAFFSGLFIYQDKFFLAGAVLLFSGFLDLMDGAVARMSKKQSPFGGILDSSLDRYGDGFVLGALSLYFGLRGEPLIAILCISALLGSFAISYVRARAECVITKCKVGFWERGERLVYLALGLLFNNIVWVIWVLAVMTHMTVLGRLYYSKKEAEKSGHWETRQGGIFDYLFQRHGRGHWLYALKITALFLAVIFIRLS